MSFLRRVPWYLAGGLILGIALGLVYAWLISPVQYVDGTPDKLRSDFKDQYRLLIASSYQADGNLALANTRLAVLGDLQPASALDEQASQMLAQGDPDGKAYLLIILAQALEGTLPTETLQPTDPPTPTTAVLAETSTPVGIAGMPTDTPADTNTPGGTPEDLTGTPEITDTPGGSPQPTATLYATPTHRHTRTPIPTPGEPYELVSREVICSAQQLSVLLRIDVRNAAGEPVPGEEIIISWNNGREHIFTGLKPELGDGIADFAMTPGNLYSVQFTDGGEPVTELEAPPCESGGVEWWGSLLLTFRQP